MRLTDRTNLFNSTPKQYELKYHRDKRSLFEMLMTHCIFSFLLSVFSSFYRPNLCGCFDVRFNHPNQSCTHFRWMSHEDRKSVLQTHQSCLNCLSDLHMRENCTFTKRCDVWSHSHHTMIHWDEVLIHCASFLHRQTISCHQKSERQTLVFRYYCAKVLHPRQPDHLPPCQTSTIPL